VVGKGGERLQTLLLKHVVEVDCFENTKTLAGADVSSQGTASAAYIGTGVQVVNIQMSFFVP
jgi:hypothetical protein